MRNLDRRELLVGSAAVLAAGRASAQDAPLATTRAGQVRGRTVDGIKVFQGVPYGTSTEGRRFLPPQPPAAWTGVRDALDFGHQSPQLGAERPSVYASWANPAPPGRGCLALNVHPPALTEGRKRPVVVLFHGGGFTSGSASSH